MHALSLERFSVIVRRAYQAGRGEIPWAKVLKPIMRAINCCAGVFCVQSSGGSILLLETAGIKRITVLRYLKSREQIKNDSIRRCMKNPNEGVISHRNIILESHSHSDDCENCSSTPGTHKFCIGLKFFVGRFAPQITASFTFYTSLRRINPPAGASRILSCLMPHLRYAVQMVLSKSFEKTDLNLLANYLDTRPEGTFLLNQFGEVCFCNKEAEKIIFRGDGLSLDENRIYPLRVFDREKLESELKVFRVSQNANDHTEVHPRQLLIKRAGDVFSDYLVEIAQLENSLKYGNVSDATISVVIKYVRKPNRKFKKSLEHIYGLTRRQAELASALSEGHNLNEAAAAIGVARNTAKVHLREIFAKTGVTRQVDLIRIVSLFL